MKNKGFTLIELLVVIAIIGLLASIVMINLNNARAKARDARRKAEINQIVLALQMYYDDNERYPSEAWCDSSTGSCGHACPCGGSDWSTTSGIYVGLVGGGYMSSLPLDPTNNDTYYYEYEPDCNQGNCPSPAGCCYYVVRVRLEGGGTFILQGY